MFDLKEKERLLHKPAEVCGVDAVVTLFTVSEIGMVELNFDTVNGAPVDDDDGCEYKGKSVVM